MTNAIGYRVVYSIYTQLCMYMCLEDILRNEIFRQALE